MESAITVKGQATIPKVIRDHLRLKPGDRVKFFIPMALWYSCRNFPSRPCGTSFIPAGDQ
jgi:AbrB family looped-hinge helix DNA binding protein